MRIARADAVGRAAATIVNIWSVGYLYIPKGVIVGAIPFLLSSDTYDVAETTTSILQVRDVRDYDLVR
jgi:hypothetical protein